MPPESDTVLSGDAHSPCAGSDSPVTRQAGATPKEARPLPTAPASLPVLELHRRLHRIHDFYTGLVDFYPGLAWQPQPDPVRMCQILLALDGQLENLADAIRDARSHVSLLFDLSFDEGTKRGLHGDVRER
jgi:hypothetical protein